MTLSQLSASGLVCALTWKSLSGRQEKFHMLPLPTPDTPPPPCVPDEPVDRLIFTCLAACSVFCDHVWGCCWGQRQQKGDQAMPKGCWNRWEKPPDMERIRSVQNFKQNTTETALPFDHNLASVLIAFPPRSHCSGCLMRPPVEE